MESRFRELLAEAIQVAEEYRSDFGSLKPPPAVTSFRYKSSGKARPKKNQKPAAAAKGASTPPKAIAKTNPKTTDPRGSSLLQSKELEPRRFPRHSRICK
jgi:hypothetical protein